MKLKSNQNSITLLLTTLFCVPSISNKDESAGSMFHFPTTPGKIMFFAPLVSRSMIMTFMPLAETLAKRGHKVTVVIPLQHDTDLVEVVTIESRYEEFFSNISRYVTASCIVYPTRKIKMIVSTGRILGTQKAPLH